MSNPTAEQKAAIRAQLLASRAPKTRIVKINGIEVELRQQSLAILFDDTLNNSKMSALERSIRQFIEHAYYPGTDERIFEVTDVAVIKSWPFDTDWIEVQKAIAELSGIRTDDVEAAEKDLTENP